MDNSMERIIADLKELCLREHLTNGIDASAAARGMLGSIKRHAPEMTYTVAEVCDLLQAIRDIEFSDTSEKRNALGLEGTDRAEKNISSAL